MEGPARFSPAVAGSAANGCQQERASLHNIVVGFVKFWEYVVKTFIRSRNRACAKNILEGDSLGAPKATIWLVHIVRERVLLGYPGQPVGRSQGNTRHVFMLGCLISIRNKHIQYTNTT